MPSPPDACFRTMTFDVSDLARSDVVTVESTASLDEVARLMRERGVGCVVVEEGGRMAGIVTDRDLAVRGFDTDDPRRATAADVMTANPATVDGDAGVLELTATMQTEGVRRMPVVDEAGELAGIVTQDDVAQLLVEEASALAGVLEEESPPG
jgi:CBS domain-containing protein